MTGSHLDFGARIYDARIGRFLSIDPMATKFPSESNFIFAGNSPIYLIDFKGKYKLPSDEKEASRIKKDYPTLVKYLESNVKEDIMSSQLIMSGLSEHTMGNLTKDEVDNMTTWNNGPHILITDNPGFDDDGWILKGANGWYNRHTNTIQISTHLAAQLETASPEDKLAALYSLFVVLTHESVHYGDILDGEAQPGEPGNDFEKIFYEVPINDPDNPGEYYFGPPDDAPDIRNIKDSKTMMDRNDSYFRGELIPTIPSSETKD